jgi:hypothetical protein
MKNSFIFCQIFNKTSAPSQNFAVVPDIKFKENPFSVLDLRIVADHFSIAVY